jgi:3-oxoacyl-(acyl-carrier-protein) reductase
MKMRRFENQVAVVTGSGRGLGKAFVERFAKEGAKVVVTDINEEACIVVRDEIIAAGGEAIAIACDVTNRAQVADMMKTVIETYGQIDVLVNNAGITRDASFMKMTDDQFDLVINTNMKSMFICTQEAVKYMFERKYGRVINISSLTGVAGNFGQTNYGAAKAGVIGMTKTWSKEFGRKGVTCNAVAPGFMMTEMTLTMKQEIIDNLISQIPVGRGGDPKELAGAVAFLASEEAGFINGATLNINGGTYCS